MILRVQRLRIRKRRPSRFEANENSSSPLPGSTIWNRALRPRLETVAGRCLCDIHHAVKCFSTVLWMNSGAVLLHKCLNQVGRRHGTQQKANGPVRVYPGSVLGSRAVVSTIVGTRR